MAYTIEIREKGYLLFTIRRSETRNAINYDVMNGLSEAINRAKQTDIKALVITGEGDRAFCSGGDLSVFHLLKTKEAAYAMLSKMATVLYSLLICPKPTIALMNGAAIGGGCELAAACDFRIAREGIKAGFVQGNQAITTGWGGGSILTEKLSSSTSMKLLMEAEIYTAETLRDIGFINEVYNQDSVLECERYLRRLLSIDLTVLESYKMMWIRKWEETGLRERIEKEVMNCAVLWESETHIEQVNRFINKKTQNTE
ncbi:enoyl-CoA hydratase/isomerase family protein [Bacillus sp. MRMR6]|uniref:enoyl-CoA hydratase/isomerase family protein n=1 Tax=Bacillus sp. MRMR6 TaxID=1928617 RepID=UPI000951F3FF|nr:enoyl-CoA hydratase/isomerase family protein [Bacillus sp. MRMR6]OLS41997.1 enoyl-CoA hydratase [Bacillus sp. MRMR6]